MRLEHVSRGCAAFLIVVLLCTAPLSAQAVVVTFLTSGTTYVTPGDWNNSNNTIECIGPGGNGSQVNTGGAGGGGGAYAKIVNLTLSGSISYVVGLGGTQNDTYFKGAASTTASLSCAPGKNAVTSTGGAGGLTTNSTGTTKFAGGAGASTAGGGGGGGAGGTTSDGSTAVSTTGGNGGTVSGGAGGAAGVGSVPGDPGGAGTVWTTAGAGGGGGQGGWGEGEAPSTCNANGEIGGQGGLYGGGAGGGGGRSFNFCLSGPGGSGADGIITITYTPLVVASSAVRRGISIRGSSLIIRVGGMKIR